ncbi:hypothetical protein G6F56_011321 [Rhizopus delemar]|nr:hypothetical protein G6F56_011321 [Rhizopus delemar]
MDPFTISDVENLIQLFYNSSDTNTTKQIQEQLQLIQKESYSWEIASQLLASSSEQCRFFGAHTFQIKITRDWDTLPENKIKWLQDELLGWIVRLCTGPTFIMTKLYTALIAFAFHTVPHQWTGFILQTIEVLQMGRSHSIDPDVLIMGILEFSTLVPEEVSHANLLGGRKLQLMEELKKSVPLILSRLSTYIQSENTTIRSKTLKCLQSWIQYGLDLE